MDPYLPIPPVQPASTSQPFNTFLLVPNIFASIEGGNEFLSTLDSDTRDYVIKHSGEFSSKADIIDCIDKLHGVS